MKPVFADSGYWIALFDPTDSLHSVASAFHQIIEVENTQIITSQLVLIEFLNFFSRSGRNVRQQASNTAMEIQQYPNFAVIPQTTDLFDRALKLYAQRPDKQWSLTDCSSFLIMQDLGMTEALAYDKHFEQAGFRVLLRE
jgi:uncharacterized protein